MIYSYRAEIQRHIANLLGWTTQRKIVVVESDDWGSIRMPSKETYNNLIIAGIQIQDGWFNLYDSLESNQDMENLLEVITSYRDRNGNHPAFTAVCVVANPDFEKIGERRFQEYHFEPFTETLKRYPSHDRVLRLWKEGVEKRIFVPQFHGREHLNVQRWLRDLQAGKRDTIVAFQNQLWGISTQPNHYEYLPAFDLDFPDDLKYMGTVLEEGLDLFEKILGYSA
ncbi:MAG: hypothetical protein JXB60_04380, partial [Candidatus Cloacimonetes bacterium]|nr:hypothetical protein [Candidatus Cloacimonadota bacterium]